MFFYLSSTYSVSLTLLPMHYSELVYDSLGLFLQLVYSLLLVLGMNAMCKSTTTYSMASVTSYSDMKNLIGEVTCRICQENFSATITGMLNHSSSLYAVPSTDIYLAYKWGS